MSQWEFLSISNFVEDKEDNEEQSFSYAEACKLSGLAADQIDGLKPHVSWFIRQCQAKGLTYDGREKPRTFRTISSNSHDRWSGNPCAGGSGTAGGVWTGAKNASHRQNDK